MHIYYPHTSTFSRVSEIWCAFSVELFKQAGGRPSTEGHSCLSCELHCIVQGSTKASRVNGIQMEFVMITKNPLIIEVITISS